MSIRQVPDCLTAGLGTVVSSGGPSSEMISDSCGRMGELAVNLGDLEMLGGQRGGGEGRRGAGSERGLGWADREEGVVVVILIRLLDLASNTVTNLKQKVG